MDNKDNANPTILQVSDLPTRQNQRLKNKTKKKDRAYLALRQRGPLDAPYDEFSDDTTSDSDGGLTVDPIDAQEIYDLISTISDPEHPLSLGQLAVVNLPDIHITPYPTATPSTAENSSPKTNTDKDTLVQVLVKITPTITHCSLATVIGLGIRVRLEQALAPNYRVDVMIKEGTHAQDDQVNKQLADKERVAAALENATLKGVLDKMLETCV
ncbi:FAM96B protein [Astrocystis sublimbata]|nr:FAM96B protein [Astrocystis sublimbata]